MSLPAALKIGGAALTAGGVPAASFAVYDSFFSLYKQEKDVLESSVYPKVTIHTPDPADSDTKHTYLKIHNESNWECIVKAVAPEDTPTASNSQSDFVSAIENKLPKSNDSSSSDVEKAAKQRNKKNLVKNCSKNRKSLPEQPDGKVVSEITIFLSKKSGSSPNVKWELGEENLNQLFGKGFWI